MNIFLHMYFVCLEAVLLELSVFGNHLCCKLRNVDKTKCIPLGKTKTNNQHHPNKLLQIKITALTLFRMNLWHQAGLFVKGQVTLETGHLLALGPSFFHTLWPACFACNISLPTFFSIEVKFSYTTDPPFTVVAPGLCFWDFTSEIKSDANRL